MDSLEIKPVKLVEESQTQRTKSNIHEATVNAIKGTVGAGILALPYVFLKTGLILAILLLTLVSIFCLFCVHCAFSTVEKLSREKGEKFKCDNYLRVFGEKGMMAYRIFTILFYISICISYVILFIRFFQIAFAFLHAPKYLYGILAFLTITPITYVKNLHFLTKYMIIALTLAIITLLVIFEFAFEKAVTDPYVPNLFNFAALSSTFGVIFFAVSGLPNYLLVVEAMENPDDGFKAIKRGLVFSLLLYMVFSVVCGIGLGAKLNGIVFMGLEKKRAYFFVFQAFYAISLMLTMPLQLYTALVYIEKNEIYVKYLEKYSIMHYIWRTLFSFILFFIGTMIPNFVDYLNMTGAIFATIICFIFPIISYMKTHPENVFGWRKGIYIAVLAFLIINAIYLTYQSVKNFAKSK